MPATNVNWPTPLTRLNPWYPGQFGVPGTDSETGLRLNTGGCIFWVDPNHVDANDNRDGTNPTAPLATVAAAIAQCEAYRGDVIAVMHSGYWTYGDMTADNITPVQEAVTIDVPGVRLVGVSSSSLGVPWVGTANNDELITVTALDVTIEGFCFWEPTYTGVTAIAAVWNGPPYGENLTVRHCYFYQLAYGVTLDFTYNCFVEDCSFYGIGTAAIYNPGAFGDPDYLVVRGCLFNTNTADILLGDTDSVLIEGNRFTDVTTGVSLNSGASNQILHNTFNGDPTVAISATGGANNVIMGNAIQADPTGTNNMINLTGGASNLVCNNCLSCTIAQYDTTCSDGTSGSWGGNHCSDGDTTAAPT